jgi:hypothetical protein
MVFISDMLGHDTAGIKTILGRKSQQMTLNRGKYVLDGLMGS